MSKFFELIKDENPQIIIGFYKCLTDLEDLFLLVERYNINVNDYKEIQEFYNKLIKIKDELPIEGIQLSINPYLDIGANPNVYYLNNDLSYTKPNAFSIYREKEVPVASYKSLYENILLYLYKIDSDKLYMVIDKTKFNGRIKAYFSNNSKELLKPFKISNNLYGETFFSANGFRDMIIKLFNYYNIDINNLRIFISYDRKEKFGYYK